MKLFSGRGPSAESINDPGSLTLQELRNRSSDAKVARVNPPHDTGIDNWQRLRNSDLRAAIVHILDRMEDRPPAKILHGQFEGFDRTELTILADRSTAINVEMISQGPTAIEYLSVTVLQANDSGRFGPIASRQIVPNLPGLGDLSPDLPKYYIASITPFLASNPPLRNGSYPQLAQMVNERDGATLIPKGSLNFKVSRTTS